ncbi:TRAM domain-containing protein [Candidatus Woesearchaeota archaeon]|nr:TRAM domain-containing protein [Candidatus Woesearchaeota archaeon]MCF7900794.1 TRAM domain-containing protein [Candidatus Woesearchaeota archaeon]MCF8013096.1 TRAM domain-containing protein [Candidatus Woesearchaeota archaeon]
MQRFGNSGGYEQKSPPVQVGEELDVRIEAVGEKGDGVAKVRGFVLFIPGAKENEELRVKITRVLRQVGFAEVIGKAEGPIADDKPQQKETPIKEARKAPVQEEFKYDETKDSEDFGDEPLEETSKENSEEELNESDEDSEDK